MEDSLEFDDVLVRPIPSEVCSRDDVDIRTVLPNGIDLNFPLLASPMVGVTDAKFAYQLSKLGGAAILHRFYASKKEHLADIEGYLAGKSLYGVSIKIDEDNFEDYFEFNPTIVLIDTANGYTTRLLKYCERVKGSMLAHNCTANLMAGNVVTAEGCKNLIKAGCDMIRVGIGGGSLCSTRNQTGVGISNISAIQECVADSNNPTCLIIDGGIKNSGDFVKAVVAGADLGMSGRLYAECFEAPNKGVLYGMASRTHMKNTNTHIKSVEGFDVIIEKKHSLEQFVREFGYGIKSAATYLNANYLWEIYTNGTFVRVTDHSIKKGI